MALESGSRLGTYEISDLLGKGGMGEVYRARDTRLDREVAIKTLPPEFAEDAPRLARFEREAKLLASLNHPNIAAIYGFEEHEGARFLVLELVEGETLEELLGRGAIPVDESLDLALQITGALEVAHDKGVLHRDLKPANIKVTPDGTLKVLDFGLAKAFEPDGAGEDPSNSPTISMTATRAGVILGTAAYMSPEQAKGGAVDRRADVWAFGCVLYEMLSGRQSFGQSTVTESLAAVIRAEPDWGALPPTLHPRLREVLERCLEKDPRARYRDIGDAGLDIERARSSPVRESVEPVAVSAGLPLAWIAAAIVLAAGVGLGAWVLKPVPVPVTTRFTIPMEGRFQDDAFNSLGLSPDGQTIVYALEDQLYRRDLGQLESRPIPGTENGFLPFFSPDSRWLGFASRSQAAWMRVPLAGGPSEPVSDQAGVGASWGQGGNVIVHVMREGALKRVPEGGGDATVVTTRREGEQSHPHPDVLPGGQAALFAILFEDRTWRIAAVDLESGEHRVFFEGSHPRYVPTGHVVFVREGALWATGFDLDRLEPTGEVARIQDDVHVAEPIGMAQYAVAGGTLVYRMRSENVAERVTSLVWVDADGTVEPVGLQSGELYHPRVSRDGTQVAVQRRDGLGSPEIWIWNVLRETRLRLADAPNFQSPAVWFPDGSRLAYTGADSLDFYSQSTSNTGTRELLVSSPIRESLTNVARAPTPYGFSPDGSDLIFRDRRSPVGGDNIGIVRIDGTSEPEWLLEGQSQERNAEVSQDGNWLAYDSDETGRFEISVRPFPDTNQNRWSISTDGGVHPVWSRDGEELFYLEPGDPTRLMAVRVQTSPTFDFERPRVLMEWPYQSDDEARQYDVASDGRFLALELDPEATAATEGALPEIVVVTNWTEELLERVPVD